MSNGRINKNTNTKKSKIKKIPKKQNNVLTLKRKKKVKIRRVIFSFLFISVIFIILLLNLSIFKIKHIELTGNKDVDLSELQLKVNKLNDKNIFSADYDKIKNDILDNPYIESVVIKKIIPDKVNVIINEKKALFYINNGKYFIIDKEGTVLKIDNQVKSDIIEITGIDIKDNVKLKDKIDLDKLHKDVINEILDLLSKNTSDLKPYKFDISNLSNLNLYINDIEVKMGDLYNIKEKLNVAFTVINEFGLSDKTGYVDVNDYKLPVYNCE